MKILLIIPIIFAIGCEKINYTMPRHQAKFIDTTYVKSILQGTHLLSFSDLNWPVSNPSDTSSLHDMSLTITISGNTYSVLNPPTLPLFIPGGEGIFVFTSTRENQIYFINTREFPPGVSPGYILNDLWSFDVYDTYVLLSKKSSYTVSPNIDYQSISTFKIVR